MRLQVGEKGAPGLGPQIVAGIGLSVSLLRRSIRSLFQTMRLGAGRTTPPAPGQIDQQIPAARLHSTGAAVDFPLGSWVCFFCGARSA